MKRIAIEEHISTGEAMPNMPAPGGGGKSPDNIDNLESRLKEMDAAGIDMQVLSVVFHGDDMSAADAVAMIKRSNDRVAGLVKQNPQRFAGFATIAHHDPAAAADEMERGVTQLGLVGGFIYSSFRGEYLDNEKYRVILERAEKLGVPIYLHPTPPSPDMIKPFMTYPILSSSMFGFAVETSLHALRLICSGTFDRFPDLKIILGNLGEGLPFWLWRLDNRWQREKDGMYKSDTISARIQKKPSAYIRDNFYVSTSGMFWPPALEFVRNVLGADRMMLGVDFPQESSIEAVEAIESAALSAEDKEQIFHLNAESVLGIK